MRRLVFLVAACAAAFSLAPGQAAAGPCGLPSTRPIWFDYADGSVPFWQMFAQPGVVVAASNFIFPPQIRARGAQTVYWDMYLRNRVGTTVEPLDPATVVFRANRLYEYAAAASGCTDPVIVENELFGAHTITPWSPTNAQYRANVLTFLRTLAARGARPVLLVSSRPYTEGEAGEWWRQVGRVSDIVREVYFPAPLISRQGPVLGNRSLRAMFRRGVIDFLQLGIPSSRLGIMLGFHTTPGKGGREQLRAHLWFEVTKWQVLAAKQVAREYRLAWVSSWGWASWRTTPGEQDPDKAAAACVYLWTRNPKLCNGPTMAGPGFNASLTEGQLRLRRGTRCTVADRQVRAETIRGLKALTGDEQAALTAAFARAAASTRSRVSTRQVLEAERTLIRLRFGRSRAAYLAALRRAHASRATARGVIFDELLRAEIAPHLPVRAPSAPEIQSYYETYANVAARRVEANPAPSWLGGRRAGFALASLAPAQLFKLRVGRRATVRTLGRSFKVRALGEAMPLGAVPLAKARPAIVAALRELSREDVYSKWLLRQQHHVLKQTICWRDQLPAVGVVPLTDYVPFLALEAGAVTSRPG